MRSLQVSFKGKRVIIIGGGTQAWIKGKTFLEEGANVIFYAPTFIEQIPKQFQRLQTYQKDMLQNAILVYACTNDTMLNETIVQDANEMQIFAMSIHQSEGVSMHALQSFDAPYLHVALTTKGSSIAYGKHILDHMKESYEHEYEPILKSLSIIRSYVIQQGNDEQQRTSFLKDIANKRTSWIHFLASAIQKKQAIILCLHGSKEKMAFSIVEDCISQYTMPIYVTYQIPCKEVYTIKEMKQVLQFLNIKAVYIPLTLEKGKIYQQICTELVDEDVRFFHVTPQDIQQCISYYENQTVLFVMHSAKHSDMYLHFQSSLHEHMYIMRLHDELPEIKESKVRVVPLFLLKGKHFMTDILSQEGIVGLLQQQGKEVIVDNQCLLQQPWFQSILHKIIST